MSERDDRPATRDDIIYAVFAIIIALMLIMSEQGFTPQEVRDLAQYVKGMADATQNVKLGRAADCLLEASEVICAGGFWTCGGGPECTSDHK